MRRAKADPDLSQKLSKGLSYLNADEMEEMQQALAMAIYAHMLTSNHGGGYEAVKVLFPCQTRLIVCAVSGDTGRMKLDRSVPSCEVFAHESSALFVRIYSRGMCGGLRGVGGGHGWWLFLAYKAGASASFGQALAAHFDVSGWRISDPPLHLPSPVTTVRVCAGAVDWLSTPLRDVYRPFRLTHISLCLETGGFSLWLDRRALTHV